MSTRPDAWRSAAAVLPADGATLARSLSGGLMLVAHTGEAHLGLPVDRALLRHLTRARPAAPVSSRASDGNDAAAAARVVRPGVIPFRHATSHTVLVADGHLQLGLHATGDPGKPDVHVELRMHRALLERLARHQTHRYRRDCVLALAGLALACALVATLLLVA